MSFSPLIRHLIDALRGLPGVGPKTAQRMALHLLERDRDVARHLAGALATAMDGVGYCSILPACSSLAVSRFHVSPMVYRWAASWNISTAAPWPTLWLDARR